MSVVYFLKQKSEVYRCVRKFVEFAERQIAENVKHLRLENGGDYSSDELDTSFKQWGIVSEDTEPYTAQQNGVADRSASVLMDKATSMMKYMTVPDKFWGKPLATAVHISNVTPSSVLKRKTPTEKWYGK